MQPFIRNRLIAFILLLAPLAGFTQPSGMLLRSRIQAIIDTSSAKVGVGISGLDFKDSLTFNGNERYPMQSVYKFPLAVAVLHKVDAGKLSLTQSIHIPRENLDTATWSPMVKDFPGQDIDITLTDLLRYSMSQSDNNACDVLFSLIGGTTVVDKYMHDAGIRDISIKATEAQMKAAWNLSYTNWCKPAAMLQLLRLFYEGKLLSHNNTVFLMDVMANSVSGPKRIKGLLPKNAVVAHKTGTSSTNAQGITAATNDVGIITLPNGRHYALVIYVSDLKGGNEKGERMIASISKLVWDYFSEK